MRTFTENPRPWVEARASYAEHLDQFPAATLPPERGPWDDEPDRAEWIDAATGRPCLMQRGSFGAWCGYVEVGRKSPLYQQDYSTIDGMIRVHGGLTFAGPWLAEGDWWFGFDCGHAFDIQPAMLTLKATAGLFAPTYRKFDYVVDQVTGLARDLTALASSARGGATEAGQ